MEMQPSGTSAKKKAYWIEFIGDRSIKIEEGQTVLDASLKAGIPHYHACGGNGRCTTCRILVQNGSEYLSPLSRKEKVLGKSIPFPTNVRLACQTFVTGSPVFVHRIIRDEVDIRLYIDDDLKDDLQNIGEEKELALFFLDIRNFTPFIEGYLPFDVIHVIRRLFSLFRKCIEENKGRIIETAGDGLYAVFGFSETVKQAADNAYNSATCLINELEQLNDEYFERYFFHRFQVGIGLHAGKVIVGNIGIGVNNNLTVMGLPVNIASRIQALTKSLNNNFIVSDSFFHLLTPAPSSQPVKSKLKGVREEQVLHLCGRPYTEK